MVGETYTKIGRFSCRVPSISIGNRGLDLAENVGDIAKNVSDLYALCIAEENTDLKIFDSEGKRNADAENSVMMKRLARVRRRIRGISGTIPWMDDYEVRTDLTEDNKICLFYREKNEEDIEWSQYKQKSGAHFLEGSILSPGLKRRNSI